MPRIAFLSTAHIHTRGFIDNILKAGDGRQVAAIWDDVPARGQRYAAEARAPFEADLDTLLADPSIDGYIVCAENTRHLPLLRKVLPAGRPVFCEKPLVTTTADLAEVQTLLRAHPATLFCGYFQPFDADMLAVTQLLRDHAFGRITRIRYRNAHHAAYGRWFDNPDLAWFHNPALSGGGAFMDMGTHALHLVRTLFGPATEVWATIENHSACYPDCDDCGIAHLRFANGIFGTIEAAWTQTGGLGGLEITGSEQSLWNTPAGYVLGAPGKPAVPLIPASGGGKPTRVDRLVAVIRGEIPADELKRDFDACADAVSLMAAAYASARSGHWTPVR
ncbi:MAG: Gfo/Idh/MocA family oxidoreductase [Opitutaceae bacterium]|jgi:predicted dehydrogenase|nr:Gfo/Idh/MocA family oxidoreductase [Opitutaceae bacterium]